MLLLHSYKVVSLLIENGADCSLKGAGGYSAQQLVDIYNITCCRHLMKSNLTLPALTKATKNHLKLVPTAIATYIRLISSSW